VRPGILLRRLLTALSLAAALAYGLGPAATLASEAGHAASCVEHAESPSPAAPGHRAAPHPAACCGLLCIPALAAGEMPVPPPDRRPVAVIHPADTTETGIEIGSPSPPPRP
jgi:hypothetical protein